MPRAKEPCPKCGNLKEKRSKVCKKCHKPTHWTPELRKRMSEHYKGRIPYWWKGQKHSPEDLEKMSKAWTPEMREAARQRALKRMSEYKNLVEIGRKLSGENNPNYQGKGEETPYAPGWGRTWKKRMRDRANGKCEYCNREVGYTLDLHHKDFSTDNHHPDNLIALCRSCHKLEHFANSDRT